MILDDVTQHDQIRPLLPATGQSLILVTTRRRLLGLGDARTLTLDVLSPDDAVALFRRDAGDERAGDCDQVTEVVNLCGRLPLAIQLAAGRAAHDQALRLGDLIAELSQSPTRLGGTGAASPEVISAFDLSYGALEPDHQRFFRRLGVSPCASFGLPAAAALSGCHPGRGGEGPDHPAGSSPAGQGARTTSTASTTSSAATRPCGRPATIPRPSSARPSAGCSTTTWTRRRRAQERPWATGRTRPPGWRRSGGTSCRPPGTRGSSTGSATAPT